MALPKGRKSLPKTVGVKKQKLHCRKANWVGMTETEFDARNLAHKYLLL
ncbi:hypothetical protein [Ignatzschineria sp. LJL83]